MYYNPCPPSKFRSLNGECNNVLHKTWGAVGNAFLRLIEAEYADGIYKYKISSYMIRIEIFYFY